MCVPLPAFPIDAREAVPTPTVLSAGFLKDVQNARAIRWRILECLEQAGHPSLTDTERRQLLHFVCVGGGPTGSEVSVRVRDKGAKDQRTCSTCLFSRFFSFLFFLSARAESQFAAELHDLVSSDLPKIFPSLVPLIKISLLDASGGILNNFDASLAEYARKKFARDGIEVKVNRTVKGVEKGKLIVEPDGESECERVPVRENAQGEKRSEGAWTLTFFFFF